MAYQENPPLNELMHYGIKRRSGRYPYGSGGDPYQHSGDFLSRVKELRESNFTYVDDNGKTWSGDNAIGKSMGLNTTEFRTQLSLAKDERRMLEVDTAKGLREKGYSLNQIAEKMGYKNDSSVRSLLNKNSEMRMVQAKNTAAFLQNKIDEKGMIDVGTGVERELNISKEKLDQALHILEMQGYPVYGGRIPQPTNPGQLTTVKVVCPPGTEHKNIYNYEKINSLDKYISKDGGDTFQQFHYPKSMDSRRLKIRYGDEGGTDKDGVIEIRRGVDDLSLGNSRYAQVRILVDEKKYLKGMAVYADKMPEGIDIIFNTNKKSGVPKLDVLKDIKDDPDNPFGSLIKKNGQDWYVDKNGKKQLSLINKRSEEGDWSDWKDKLPSQFLSKQSLQLAQKQLNLAVTKKIDEYNEISSLTNPTVKKRLLESFADDCDSAAVHLYAAALPRQKYHVILPINSLKDNEIYAPKYDDGEQVALVRYPHGGTFEIPTLKVNNKHMQARKLLGTDIADAVGINSKVAERLSGADFDGDTVMVIPSNSKTKIISTNQLEKLKGFDPKDSYGSEKRGPFIRIKDGKKVKEYDYYNQYGKQIKIMNNTQTEMGKISNLITDMTLKGATTSELARAVKHSMVVIDAEKHKLDYKQSYIDNGIDALKKNYQGRIENGKYKDGASTLISKAKSEISVLKRQGTPKINIKGTDHYDSDRPEGALIYKTSDDLFRPDRTVDKKTGKIVINTKDGKKIEYDSTDLKARELYDPVKSKDNKGDTMFTNRAGDIVYNKVARTQKSTKMAETDDAFSLVSDTDTPMERVYADYANKMKALANQSRLEIKNTGKIQYSSSAKSTYDNEVKSLMSKLDDSLKNAPRERMALIMTNSSVNAKKQSNPDITKEELKKLNQQELDKARNKVGAKRTLIDVTDKEWEAIQAGAISENKLSQILNNTDIDLIRQKATPKSTVTLNSAKINRISAMANSGYTINDIAKALGISTSSVSKYMKEKE